MVKPILNLLQMPIEHLFSNPFDFAHSQLGKGPERLNAVNVGLLVSKLIASALYSIVSSIAHINKTMIPTPAVRINHTIETHLSSNDLLQRAFFRIRDNFCIDPAITFEQSEDDRFASGSTASLTPNTSGTKIGLIRFDLSSKVKVFLTLLHQSIAQFDVDCIDRAYADPRQPGGVRRRQVKRKIAKNSSKRLLCDSGTVVIPVFPFHFWSLTPITQCLTS